MNGRSGQPLPTPLQAANWRQLWLAPVPIPWPRPRTHLVAPGRFAAPLLAPQQLHVGAAALVVGAAGQALRHLGPHDAAVRDLARVAGLLQHLCGRNCTGRKGAEAGESGAGRVRVWGVAAATL